MNKFFPAPQSTEASASFSLQQWREKFLHSILIGSVILGLLALLPLFFLPPDPILIAVFVGAYLMVLAAAFLRLPYGLRAGIFLLVLYAIGLNNLLKLGVGTGSARLFLLSLVIFSGLLLSSRSAIYTFGLSLGSILFVGWLTLNGVYPSPASETLGTWLTSGATFILLAGVIMIGLNSFQSEFGRAEEHAQEAVRKLEAERAQQDDQALLQTQELEHKTSYMRASTSVIRISAQIESISELMDTVVNLTAERFDLNHAGIFLLDDRRKIAYLQAASSQTGKELIARGHRVEMDSRSALSIAVERGKYYLVSGNADTRTGSDVDFPLMRSRMLLPLKARGAVIGAMDLHSEQAQAFGPDDAEIMQSLADLVAISIENVRLLNETRALVEQLETLTSYQSQGAWQKFSTRRAPAYQYTSLGVRPVHTSLTKQDGGFQIPLSLRGQSIGSITLRKKDKSAAWTERERDLLEKVAVQVALALDNSRLVEEAQKSAQRDQLIASVSNRVRETLDVDAVLKTAALELRKVFDLREAEVSLGALTPTSAGTNPADGKPSHRAKPK